MPTVRVFNPSSYTARSYFAGQREERRSTQMAKKHHHRYRRRNPLGISGEVVKDAAYSAGGALGALFLASQFSQSGWAGVAITGAASLGMLFAGKFLGGKAGEEMFKGGLTATIIRALHQAGVASNIGLGLYSPSWFGVPTASDQYLRSYGANMLPANRGAGTIFFPGPGGTMIPAPAALPPGHPAAAKLNGMGFHRFRSRYAGNY
jgi:hypothetical protein